MAPVTAVMIPNRCYACGGAEHERQIGVNSVLVCVDCGMGRVLGEPMARAYWSHDDPEAALSEVYWAARRTMFSGALREFARRIGGPGRILDLGGGVGHFAELALAGGWDAYSTDLSELAAAAAAERLGPGRSLLSSDDPELQGTFDVVTLWCVVAHVADPVALLESAARLLRPGGQMLIATPNFLFQNPYARLLNRLGRPLDLRQADHLLNFTPKAIQLVTERAGLRNASFHYFGVTEECLAHRGLGRALVPLKRVWNRVGASAVRVGLPPLGGDLQVIVAKP